LKPLNVVWLKKENEKKKKGPDRDRAAASQSHRAINGAFGSATTLSANRRSQLSAHFLLSPILQFNEFHLK
jgi:hypothetical protein